MSSSDDTSPIVQPTRRPQGTRDLGASSSPGSSSSSSGSSVDLPDVASPASVPGKKNATAATSHDTATKRPPRTQQADVAPAATPTSAVAVEPASAPQVPRVGEYELLQRLAREGLPSGCSARIARHIPSGTLHTAALYSLAALRTDAKLRLSVEREVLILRGTGGHPFISKLSTVLHTRTHLVVLTAFCEGGDLLELATSTSAAPLELSVASRIFYQLILAVSYLHSKGVVHRDIKLENVFLDSHNRVQLAHFGTAAVAHQPPRVAAGDQHAATAAQQFAGQTHQHNAAGHHHHPGHATSFMFTEPCGSQHYAAPEVLRREPYDGRLADVWSCGVVLCGLTTGQLPFYADDEATLFGAVCAGDFTPDAAAAIATLPTALRNLLHGMLQPNTARRLTVAGVLRHEFWTLMSGAIAGSREAVKAAKGDGVASTTGSIAAAAAAAQPAAAIAADVGADGQADAAASHVDPATVPVATPADSYLPQATTTLRQRYSPNAEHA